ncbi:MAG: TspO/MBR family protein [Candidatus Paceibacterota bacterium]|jgi:tryptophan-rich sensory protein
MKKKTNQILSLLFFIAVPLLGGYLSSQFSMVGTYSQIYKPDFFPPSWIFAPVWTILYILMGIAAYLVWKKGEAKKQLSLFSVQLILNLLWTPIFFGLHQYFWAFVEILILLVMIILTIKSFNEKSKTATYLMLPYLFWVIFATFLNYVIFMNN